MSDSNELLRQASDSFSTIQRILDVSKGKVQRETLRAMRSSARNNTKKAIKHLKTAPPGNGEEAMAEELEVFLEDLGDEDTNTEEIFPEEDG